MRFRRHEAMCTNGVVQVNPEMHFKIQVANVSDQARSNTKGEVISTGLPHTNSLIERAVYFAEINDHIHDMDSCMSNDEAPLAYKNWDANNTLSLQPELPTVNLDKVIAPSLEHIDMPHPSKRRVEAMGQRLR